MRKPSVEIHVREYGMIKGTNSSVGLRTRVIINYPEGFSRIHNFDYQTEAISFIEEKFGKHREGKFDYVNLFKKYGNAGYRW